jgi:hypothetical protein
MRIPNQQQPIARAMFERGELSISGVTPSNCAGIPTNIIGACFGANGPIPGKFNCPACCALRGAISWQGGGYAAAC